MPAFPRKIRGKWRVVHGIPYKPVLNKAGTPVDGGGFASRAKALAQSRAINAREGGYPPPPKIRANPAAPVLVWVCPDGQVLDLPGGHTHNTARPEAIATERVSFAEVNRRGYFRGVVINRRLYLERDSRSNPSRKQTQQLRSYALRKRLSRGVIIEPGRVK
jgi:hypothetical protein